MNRIATPALVIATCLATPALALDMRPAVERPAPILHAGLLACDNGIYASAFVQQDRRRFGNEFDFPPNAQLSRVEFVHNGQTILHGPYVFDIELWDPVTCTFIGSADQLVASDAYGGPLTESFDLCPLGLHGSGRVAVMIDANSCAPDDDCYPDLGLDPTTRDCQWIITPGAPSICAFFPSTGDFLLRIELDACPTGAGEATWGDIKQRYR